MIRKRVNLTEDTDKTVKAIAQKYGISYSGAVNMAVIKVGEFNQIEKVK